MADSTLARRELGSLIRTYLDIAGITRKDVVEATGLSTSMVNKVISGERRLQRHELDKLIDILTATERLKGTWRTELVVAYDKVEH